MMARLRLYSGFECSLDICYRAATERLALGLLLVVFHVGLVSVGFVCCVLCLSVMQRRVMMLYPSGCLNPITLHI
jgi:hypothetical protein